MATFSRSVVIHAPRAWLFERMQDYDRRLDWDEFLSEARLVGGANGAGLGVRAFCVDTSGVGMETEYVSFKPPERVAVKMTEGPWMFASFAGSWVYADLSPGQTRVTFRYSMELRPRLLGRLGDSLLVRVFSTNMERRLASAKAKLECLYEREAMKV